MSTHYRYALAQILGGRENQEDSCAIQSEGLVIRLNSGEVRQGVGRDTLTAVLCDGMGGHASGEIAAAIATEQFITTIEVLSAQSEKAMCLSVLAWGQTRRSVGEQKMT